MESPVVISDWVVTAGLVGTMYGVAVLRTMRSSRASTASAGVRTTRRAGLRDGRRNRCFQTMLRVSLVGCESCAHYERRLVKGSGSKLLEAGMKNRRSNRSPAEVDRRIDHPTFRAAVPNTRPEGRACAAARQRGWRHGDARSPAVNGGPTPLRGKPRERG